MLLDDLVTPGAVLAGGGDVPLALAPAAIDDNNMMLIIICIWRFPKIKGSFLGISAIRTIVSLSSSSSSSPYWWFSWPVTKRGSALLVCKASGMLFLGSGWRVWHSQEDLKKDSIAQPLTPSLLVGSRV